MSGNGPRCCVVLLTLAARPGCSSWLLVLAARLPAPRSAWPVACGLLACAPCPVPRAPCPVPRAPCPVALGWGRCHETRVCCVLCSRRRIQHQAHRLRLLQAILRGARIYRHDRHPFLYSTRGHRPQVLRLCRWGHVEHGCHPLYVRYPHLSAINPLTRTHITRTTCTHTYSHTHTHTRTRSLSLTHTHTPLSPPHTLRRGRCNHAYSQRANSL